MVLNPKKGMKFNGRSSVMRVEICFIAGFHFMEPFTLRKLAQLRRTGFDRSFSDERHPGRLITVCDQSPLAFNPRQALFSLP